MQLEIVNNARESYIKFLREEIEHLRREKKIYWAEILIQPDESVNPPPFCLIRADIMSGPASAPQIIRVADGYPSSVPVNRYKTSSGIEVKAGPISWESCSISFLAPGFRLELLEPWLVTWLDTNELKKEDEYGLSGVAHSIAWSSDDRGNWELIVDFGSAPTKAFDELLQMLASQGIRKCTLAVGPDDESE